MRYTQTLPRKIQVRVYRCHLFVGRSNGVFCTQERATGVL